MPTSDRISNLSLPRALRTPMRVRILGTPAPESCVLARFTAGLSRALSAHGVDVGVVGDAASPNSSDEPLNRADVVIVQHDFCAGVDAVIDAVEGLSSPSIVISRSVPKRPTTHQRSALEAIASTASQLVVMSDAAHQRLCHEYSVDRRKVSTIPHGATVPAAIRTKRPSRPTILTWGWLAPGTALSASSMRWRH